MMNPHPTTPSIPPLPPRSSRLPRSAEPHRFVCVVALGLLLALFAAAPSPAAAESPPTPAAPVETEASDPSPPDSALARQFDLANREYEAGHYERARDLYSALLAEAPGDAILHFNLGNAYARLGDTARAVLQYERALRLHPRLADARHNLLCIAPPANHPEVNPLAVPFLWVRARLNVNEWLVLFFAMFMLSSLFGAAWALDDRRPALWKTLTSTCLVLLFAVGIFAFASAARDLRPEAVVLVEKAMARSGPGENFLEAMELPAGVKIALAGEPQRGWVRFRTPDGSVAWMRTAELERI